MKLRRIKHTLLRLSAEEKLQGIGSLLVLIGAFLPWYSVALNFNETAQTESGFTGDLGVVGFIVFLLTGLGIAHLLSDHLGYKLPKFGYKKEQISMFLSGQSAFLLLLSVAVYTKRSFLYTSAGIRFGLWLSLAGAVLAAFAAFAIIQKSQKRETEAIFSHSEEKAEVEAKHLPEKERIVNKVSVPQTEQKSFFYEEAAEKEKRAMETEEITVQGSEEPETTESIQNEILEEEPVETPEETEAAEIIEEDKPVELSTEVNEEGMEENQGSYFMKEAGVKPNIKVSLESINKVEQNEPKKAEAPQPANESMGFYDDL